jgi:hypothetical protein
VSGQPSAQDWAAAILAAITLFAAGLVPFFLLVDASLSPRRAVRALARRSPADSPPRPGFRTGPAPATSPLLHPRPAAATAEEAHPDEDRRTVPPASPRHR